MKTIATTLFLFFFAFNASAADVICSNPTDESKSEVKINFVPSNPGLYMTFEYAFGNINKEGFAIVTRDKKEGRVLYKLDRYVLVEKDGKYSMPGYDLECK